MVPREIPPAQKLSLTHRLREWGRLVRRKQDGKLTSSPRNIARKNGVQYRNPCTSYVVRKNTWCTESRYPWLIFSESCPLFLRIYGSLRLFQRHRFSARTQGQSTSLCVSPILSTDTLPAAYSSKRNIIVEETTTNRVQQHPPP